MDAISCQSFDAGRHVEKKTTYTKEKGDLYCNPTDFRMNRENSSLICYCSLLKFLPHGKTCNLLQRVLYHLCNCVFPSSFPGQEVTF